MTVSRTALAGPCLSWSSLIAFWRCWTLRLSSYGSIVRAFLCLCLLIMPLWFPCSKKLTGNRFCSFPVAYPQLGLFWCRALRETLSWKYHCKFMKLLPKFSARLQGKLLHSVTSASTPTALSFFKAYWTLFIEIFRSDSGICIVSIALKEFQYVQLRSHPKQKFIKPSWIGYWPYGTDSCRLPCHRLKRFQGTFDRSLQREGTFYWFVRCLNW